MADKPASEFFSQMQQPLDAWKEAVEAQTSQVNTMFEGAERVRAMQNAQAHLMIENWSKLLKTGIEESNQMAQAWHKTTLDSSHKMMDMLKGDWSANWPSL
ncbi:MAG: hypothetical protein AAFX99_04235 [Myxococcota bacterium]